MHTRLTRHVTAAAVLPAVAVATLTACGGQAASTAAPPARVTVAGAQITRDAALHDALPAGIKDSDTVRVATDAPYAPFAMFVTEGKPDLTGLDYDLGQALGAKLGVRFAFTPQKFDGIVPAVQAGKFDVAMSALTDTKERRQVLDFVDYSVSGSGVLVAKGNPARIAKLDDLCGRNVGVEAATHQLQLLQAHQAACKAAGRPQIGIQTFPKDSDAQLALRSGKVVADVLTKPAAGWTAKTADGGGAFEVVNDPSASAGYGATPNGIGVSKNLPQLTEAIRKALQQLIDEGTLTRICDKYGGASIAVKQATKNGMVS
ncbi:ABC transporter substrate-binding protein [Streptomyces benahoarensis]|uniref:ABC transporter substrate-binding protein n=1 Tax=Streptomyces benahoarensis TaxID=2595054 RepID=A0A553ZRY8_9ACTN|nr:ABC transporter substrate-binding protein [Streptomyces benahoarensis]TSB44244.1 ABC transporter substrate-binding protein [Streptomyces benahoarensis]